jgi:hypothetical protein
VVSPEAPDGPELLLEPSGHPAVKPYRDALVEDGIPLAQFAVDDVEAEHARLSGMGVVFTQPPTDVGTAVVAVFDDTCGNLIQLISVKPVRPLSPPIAPRRRADRAQLRPLCSAQAGFWPPERRQKRPEVSKEPGTDCQASAMRSR